ncbi:MarR family transcriptional regulator [Roseicyclus sp. F158]|uniref:MarR family transcriptional regulator n=1 Tax=Tropicimonas omnivorans TaxID=3075590 RepID=A0ABU3DES7_9RHOB|nr:MarR family transcriptional regulator [Roseicyclus sp. F158]MDT0681627.1 MarR family transcriptional regulator [Roseicyclus sp. F158]
MPHDRPDAPEIAPPDRTLGELGLWQFAPYLMNRIMGRYNAEMHEALKERNLSTAKMRTLAILSVVPGLTINELAVYAVTEQSTMSRTLDAMEKAGLVRRQGRAEDARVREIFLTEMGQDEFGLVWPLMHAQYQEMFAGIALDERIAFVGTLQKVLKNVRQHKI